MTDIPQKNFAWFPPAAWLIVMISCAVFLFSTIQRGSVFESSILSLLPENEQLPLVETTNKQLSERFSRQLFLLVGGDKRAVSDEEILAALSDIRAAFSLTDIVSTAGTGFEDQTLDKRGSFFKPYRYHLLLDETRRQLQNGQIDNLISGARHRLLSPVSVPRQASFIEDPLGTYTDWVLASGAIPAADVSIDTNGVKVSNEVEHYRLIIAKFSGHPFEIGTQLKVNKSINAALAPLSAKPNLRVLRSGIFFHAEAGARQAKREISTIGAGSLLGIVILLLWNFRSPKPLFLSLVAIGSGILFALSASLLVFEKVHMITLAFGAGLIGVSIDYALHFLCSHRDYHSQTLKHIFPAISLGLLSSVLAYSAQFLTPFPGIRQMAFFSACGLIAAWMTVVCCFPALNRRPLPRTSPLGELLQKSDNVRTPLRWLAFVAVLVSLAHLPNTEFHDDLRLLQTSPDSLLTQERKIRELLSRPSTSTYFIVQADSRESLLQTEEQLRTVLDAQIKEELIGGYRALSQSVPSQKRQHDNYKLYGEQFYHSDLLPTFFESLGLPESTTRKSRSLYTSQEGQHLRLKDWLDSPAGENNAYLWLGDDEKPASIIPLMPHNGSTIDDTQMTKVASGFEGVIYVNNITQLSQLLQRYRDSIIRWISFAYIGIFILLFIRYRSGALQIILIPMLSTLCTLSLLALAGQTLNIFNVLAAFLVLGIGLDIGIFLRESRHSSATWEAVTLATLTTILAFGLLSLSRTPVLHHFGITVLPGLTFAWLFALAFSPRNKPPIRVD